MLHFLGITQFSLLHCSLFLSFFVFSSCYTFLCFTFFVLHLFYVLLFSCYTFLCSILFILHSFHVALFSGCTILMLLFCVAHAPHVALFSCCTLFMLHWFLFVKAIICVLYFATLGPNCRLIPRICPNLQKLLK